MVTVTGPVEAADFLQSNYNILQPPAALVLQVEHDEEENGGGAPGAAAQQRDDVTAGGVAANSNSNANNIAPPFDPILRIDCQELPLDAEGSIGLERFVTALHQLVRLVSSKAKEEEEGSDSANHQMEVIGFGYGVFDQHPHETLELLFGTIIPSLTSLKTIEFFMSDVHPHYLRILVNGLVQNQHPLHKLSLEYTPLSYECVKATIPKLLKRSHLQTLHLESCSLNDPSLQCIVKALPHSALTHFKCNDFVHLTHEQGQCLGHSHLQVLDLTESPLDLDSYQNLIQPLKSNETLTELLLSHDPRVPRNQVLNVWHNLLHSYNLTLTTLQVQPTRYHNHHRIDEESLVGVTLSSQNRDPGSVPGVDPDPDDEPDHTLRRARAHQHHQPQHHQQQHEQHQRRSVRHLFFQSLMQEYRGSRHQRGIDRLLASNASLRNLYRSWQTSPPQSLLPATWPIVIRAIERHPTLLYRFLREDCLEGVLVRLQESPAMKRNTSDLLEFPPKRLRPMSG